MMCSLDWAAQVLGEVALLWRRVRTLHQLFKINDVKLLGQPNPVITLDVKLAHLT